jgi:hypothetical protein
VVLVFFAILYMAFVSILWVFLISLYYFREKLRLFQKDIATEIPRNYFVVNLIVAMFHQKILLRTGKKTREMELPKTGEYVFFIFYFFMLWKK